MLGLFAPVAAGDSNLQGDAGAKGAGSRAAAKGCTTRSSRRGDRVDAVDLVSCGGDRGHHSDDAVVAAKNARGANGLGPPGENGPPLWPGNRWHRGWPDL